MLSAAIRISPKPNISINGGQGPDRDAQLQQCDTDTTNPIHLWMLWYDENVSLRLVLELKEGVELQGHGHG